MDNIRAFVGHSFSERDKPLVRKFLDHFETLAKGFPGFSWDHAEEAEAGSISEKVLRKIDGKNVFIGICTPHERAIGEEKLRRSLWSPKTLLVAEGDLQWKASDWLIQEIGLAVGRGMTIILFMEEGVRKAGGLFSDIEYVPFERDRPHESFDKFFQMLTSLTPKDAIASSGEGKASPEDDKAKIAQGGADDLEPRDDWSVLQFKNALMRSMVFNKVEDAERISAAFKTSSHSEGVRRAEWDGYVE